MRLFALQIFTILLTVRQLIGVLASPTHQPRAIEHVQEDSKLEERASTYAVVLAPVGQVHDTFAGVNLLPGVFSLPFTDNQMQEAAKATFELWDSKQAYPGQSSLLVAVIGVPGHGLAAGTIWHGMDESFVQRAQNDAPNLWRLLQRQGKREGTNQSVWHAEIVASWVAESSFPNVKEGSRWPGGTKIAVYSRETLKRRDGTEEKVVRYKPVCAPGATSNRVACSTLMQAQRIDVVNP